MTVALTLLFILTQDVEDSTLEWMARHGSEQGAWKVIDCRQCGEKRPQHRNEILDTSLAILAFLNWGYTHLSKDSISGTVVGPLMKNALTFLAEEFDMENGFCRKEDPQSMLTHIVATWALTEAFGVTNSRYLKEPAQKALQFLFRKRLTDGGWPLWLGASSSDPVATGFAASAVESARIADFPIDEQVFDRFADWWGAKVSQVNLKDALVMSVLVYIPAVLDLDPKTSDSIESIIRRVAPTVDGASDEEKARVDRLILAFESDDPAERQRAAAALPGYVSRASGRMAQAWLRTRDPEVRSRIEQALDLHRRMDYRWICREFFDRHRPEGQREWEPLIWYFGSASARILDGPSGGLWKTWSRQMNSYFDSMGAKEGCAKGSCSLSSRMPAGRFGLTGLKSLTKSVWLSFNYKKRLRD